MSDTVVATAPVSGAAEPVQGSSGSQSNNASAPAFDLSKIPEAEIEKYLDGRKEKIKVNGVERELTRAEMRKLAALSSASDEKFKNAAQEKREAAEIREAFGKADPAAALRKLGKTNAEIKQIFESQYAALLEDEQKTPEQRELEELRKAKQQAEDEKKKKTDEEFTAKQQQQIKQLTEQTEVELVDAFKSVSLPKHPLLLKFVVQEMLGAAENDVQLSASDAVKIVEKEFKSQLTNLLPQLGIEYVKAALGKDMLNQLRGEDIASVKSANSPFPKSDLARQVQARSAAKGKDEPAEKIPMSKFFREQRRG
jgi:hypothetical protein